MTKEVWAAVDQFFAPILGADAALDDALAASEAAGLPPIQVTPHQGKLLHLLTRITGARRVLEIGTLGAYSTIWIARALPSGGSIVTLEADPKHAEVARANLERAGVSALVDLRLGDALDSLRTLAEESRDPFDLVFIDADKKSIPEYFQWALKLSRVGTLIIVDNVIRAGAVVDADSTDADVQGVRRFNEMVAREPRVIVTTLQTVGSKGYDGLAFVLVTA